MAARDTSARDLPVFIPCFNNPTYVRSMVEQLRRVGLAQITLVDNGSTFPPLLDYLATQEGRCTILRHQENHGPRHLVQDAELYRSLPPIFCVTDPDLALNPNLPSDFIAQLVALTELHEVGKAGFALDISEPEKMLQEPFQIGAERCRIWEWEAQFWQNPLGLTGGAPVYRAWIDTTFAVYNKKFFRTESPLEAVRVAGRFTARHLPWYLEDQLPADEKAFYRATSRHSFYLGTPPKS